MTKHTPGPWHVVEGKLTKSALEVHANSRAICELWRRGNAKTELANARLIAAAPEMLEALCNFVAWFNKTYPEPSTHPEHEWNIANRVIAKATGEAPC